ncbi:MAG: Mur ligase domain-containing protein, partial [Trueperaceae bacterium]|nr:Mur ligase domain-containing protein [Trueperaceae bacterium]
MTLRELVADALGVRLEPTAAADLMVTGVAQDSRRVSAGTVFVARQGEVSDGHRFVPQALDQGAIAVVGSAKAPEHFDWFGTVPYIYAQDDKRALAQLAACFYGYPSRALTTIGVTGTD